MSWLFGVAGQFKTRLPAAGFHPAPIHSITLPGLTLAFGGIPETCHFEYDEQSSSGWAVVGIGIFAGNSDTRILRKDDWRTILSASSVNVSALDGHFIAMVWENNGSITFYTDQLGLRPLYFSTDNASVCFSTRLDWVARATNCSEIDFGVLGERWLLLNQLSMASGIHDIDRLGPGGRGVLRDGVITEFRHTPWLPKFGEGTLENAVPLLQSLLEAAYNSGSTPSLGLSGGLDSRMLLALLSSSHRADGAEVELHSFGNANDPDVFTAQAIGRGLGLRHTLYDNSLHSNNSTIATVCNYAAQGNLTEPVTSTMRYQFYQQMRSERKVDLDGGFGEFARRQFLNRVVAFGKSAVSTGNASRLIPHMRLSRANIFSPDAATIMNRGAHEGLEAALREMPPVHEIGIGNFADLLMLRTRVPNYGSPEQARMDELVLNFMPLVQPSYLHMVFGASVRSREHGKFYYDTIKSLQPRLTRFPLVKSGIRYPFGLTGKAGWVVTKIRYKLGKPYEDPFPTRMLAGLREFVLDLSHSTSVISASFYNSAVIGRNVEQYYNGDTRLRGFVEWWLTFELWRQSLNNQD